MHIKEPKSAALIFNSGKMVVTGVCVRACNHVECVH